MAKKNPQARTAPQVGIIFVSNRRLWVETTPLQSAGTYGEFKIHEGDHVTYWDQLILAGVVPRGLEYENVPRGRVVFNTSTKRYRLMLDRCILRRKNLVAKIEQQMGLPAEETDTDTDPHYRCAECLASHGLG